METCTDALLLVKHSSGTVGVMYIIFITGLKIMVILAFNDSFELFFSAWDTSLMSKKNNSVHKFEFI